MRYPCVIEPGDETHAFGVIFPDCPGCYSGGDTLEEALNNAPEALAGWMEDMIDEGFPALQTKAGGRCACGCRQQGTRTHLEGSNGRT